MSATLERTVRDAPATPGVYMFRAPDGTVLYVGKAVNLRARLRAYLRIAPLRPAPDLIPRIARMVARATHLELTECAHERDALILEAALIARHRPAFNVRLREGQRPVWLELSTDEDYPRLSATRDQPRPGRRYFGPFASRRAAEQTAQLALAQWPLRPCPGPRPYRPGSLPCLDYHTGRCSAPCADLISQDDYADQVAALADFLAGNNTPRMRARLEQDMRAAAADQQFERAAGLRDRIAALPAPAADTPTAYDVIGVATGAGVMAVSVLSVRAGAPVDRGVLVFDDHARGQELCDLVYPAGPPPVLIADSSTGVGRAPRSARERELHEACVRNAERALATAGPAHTRAPEDLAHLLGLPAPPEQVEMYDIAHLQGQAVRCGVVVWRDGRVVGTRVLRLPDGNDDPAQLARAVSERLTRIGGHDPLLARGPDVLCLDGGPTQRAAVAAILPPPGIPLLALAKEHETLYGESGVVPIPSDAPAARLIQALRDRAHARANGAHRRAREHLRDPLESVPGVGPARRARVRSAYPTLDALAQATPEALAALGLPAAVAARVTSFARDHAGTG